MSHLRREFHILLLEARKIENLLETSRFEDAFFSASEKELQILERILFSVDRDRLIRWIDSQLQDSFESLPVTKLRRMARDLGVPKYGYLTKQLLLSEISKRRKNDGDRDGPADA